MAGLAQTMAKGGPMGFFQMARDQLGNNSSRPSSTPTIAQGFAQMAVPQKPKKTATNGTRTIASGSEGY